MLLARVAGYVAGCHILFFYHLAMFSDFTLLMEVIRAGHRVASHGNAECFKECLESFPE